MNRFRFAENRRSQRWSAIGIFVIVLLGVIVARDPRYFTSPRFWAEEGTLHFAYSYRHSWLAALFQPQVGYLNFWPNLATKLATLVPLQIAPAVTTSMALIAQLLAVFLILVSESPYWRGWLRKLLGVMVILFIPLTQEGWLNSINSFTYFPLVAFLILLEQPASLFRRVLYPVLLVFCGLTGVLSCMLIPIFAYRAWVEKSRARWLQTAVLLVCAVIQLVLIFGFQGAGDLGQRFSRLGFATLGAALWTQSIALLAAGLERTHAWAEVLLELTYRPGVFRLIGWGLLLAAGIFFAWITLATPRELRLPFVAGYFSLLWFSLFFSIIPEKYTFLNTGLHQRLFLAPNILLGWMLLMSIRFEPTTSWMGHLRNAASFVCLALLGLGLMWGFWQCWNRWIPDDEWGNWPREVQAWQIDPAYAMKIQPPGWVITLPPPENK